MGKPIILDFATKRISLDTTTQSFEYDYEQSLNVVSINNKKIPVIKLTESFELLTQTKIANESDDENLEQYNLRMETRDIKGDEERCLPIIFELTTKTLTAVERDDEHSYYF